MENNMTLGTEDEYFCKMWGLIRIALPEDSLSWEKSRSQGIGVRVNEDHSHFSYGSSLYVDFERKMVFSKPEFKSKAEKIISQLTQDNSVGEYTLSFR